jgi:hypothetical protein
VDRGGAGRQRERHAARQRHGELPLRDLTFSLFGTISAGDTTAQLAGVNTALLTGADFIFG